MQTFLSLWFRNASPAEIYGTECSWVQMLPVLAGSCDTTTTQGERPRKGRGRADRCGPV